MKYKNGEELGREAMKKAEELQWKLFWQEGVVAYIAMMADIDLPDIETGGSDDE